MFNNHVLHLRRMINMITRNKISTKNKLKGTNHNVPFTIYLNIFLFKFDNITDINNSIIWEKRLYEVYKVYIRADAIDNAWIPSGMITAKAVPTKRPAPSTVTNFNLSCKKENQFIHWIQKK